MAIVQPIGLILCDDCKSRKSWRTIMGDGNCEKHGRYAYYERLTESCRACAKENGICQRCGKKISQ